MSGRSPRRRAQRTGTARSGRRRRPPIALMAAAIALVVAAGAAAVIGWRSTSARGTSTAAGATYVGAETCAKCHRDQYERWKGSDHARAMAPATAGTVLGDFGGATFTKDGV